jgi:hypothetical protein
VLVISLLTSSISSGYAAIVAWRSRCGLRQYSSRYVLLIVTTFPKPSENIGSAVCGTNLIDVHVSVYIKEREERFIYI